VNFLANLWSSFTFFGPIFIHTCVNTTSCNVNNQEWYSL
jgi:hypothetical protein